MSAMAQGRAAPGQHPEEHESVLKRFVTGELAADSQDVRKLAQECQECQARMNEYAAVDRTLGALLQERQDILEQASAPVDGEERLREQFRATMKASVTAEASRSRPRIRGWALLVAAAVILLGLRFWWPTSTPPVQPHLPLGSGAVECLAPRGQVEDLGSFSWQVQDLASYYRVVVRDRSGVEVCRSGFLSEQVWLPTAAQRKLIPATFDWEVMAYDRTRELLFSGSVQASWSPGD